MNHDLMHQIDAYFTEIDERQSPVTPDQVADVMGTVHTLPAKLVPVHQRPRVWVAVAAAAAVLVAIGVVPLLVGSRDAATSPETEPPVATTVPTTEPPFATTLPATPTTAPPTTTTSAIDESSGAAPLDWLDRVSDVAFGTDGSVFVAGPRGIASLDASGDWTLIDVTGLPEGAGLGAEDGFDEGWPGRMIDMIAVGPAGELWVVGTATSSTEDEAFGGQVSDWGGGRFLTWIARHDCDANPCTWQVFTSDDIPSLAGGIGDITVADAGTVYATAGEYLLLTYDGAEWVSHIVPDLPTGWNGSVSPWSSSVAVAPDGVVWAGTNSAEGGGRGLFSFDGAQFTRHTTESGLPSGIAFQVAAAPDGSIWVATDALYDEPSTAAPDAAAGVARFDGTTWTTYTMTDGLLSNDAFIASGPDGSVWAIHSEIPPYGYARFDGATWTPYPTDQPTGGFRAAVDTDGALWTATDDGLVRFDGTTTTTYPTPFTPS